MSNAGTSQVYLRIEPGDADCTPWQAYTANLAPTDDGTPRVAIADPRRGISFVGTLADLDDYALGFMVAILNVRLQTLGDDAEATEERVEQ